MRLPESDVPIETFAVPGSDEGTVAVATVESVFTGVAYEPALFPFHLTVKPVAGEKSVDIQNWRLSILLKVPVKWARSQTGDPRRTRGLVLS